MKVPSFGPHILVGILSWTNQICDVAFFVTDMEAFTSIPKMRSWIDSQIQALKV